MDESEDNLSTEDMKSTDSPLTVKNKPKKRSLIERELETNLTSRITSPAINKDGTSTSRYGRARRLKSELEQSDVKQVTVELKSPLEERSPVRTLSQSPVYKMHASNSPLKRSESPKKIVEQFLDNQIESIYQETISLSRFGNEEVSAAVVSPAKKFPKVYIRKDLIQKREPEDTVTVIQNMFSPTKSTKKSSSTHLNNILERSSERYSLNNKPQNGYMDNSSVVKTLDFDSKKKKKDNNDIKVLPSKSELFDMEAKCPYQVGDLAWARMGTYPFWPSIVTRDPSTGIFVKKKLFGRIERDIIHVTFFGDNGRRSWIVDNMLRKYVGQLEFETARENFTPEAKKKDPKLYAAYFISEKKLPLWNNSVEEAEMLLREPKRLRIDIFNDMLQKSRYNKAKQPKSKISRTDSDVSLSESLYDSLFSEEDGKSDNLDGSKSRSRKKSLDMFEVVTACLDNMAAKTGITKIQRQSHMDRWLQKAKSKTPEKTQTKTQVTIKKEDKKEAVLKVSKKRKSSTPKRPVRKSYSSRKSNESHKLISNQNENCEMEVDNVDTETNNIFSDHETSKEGNEICIISKVESLAEKTQDKIVETILSNETGHSESLKDISTCESDTYTEEYSNLDNDVNNSMIDEDKSVISTLNSETISKSLSDNYSSTEHDSSKVDYESEKDHTESQDKVNTETSNTDSSEVSHSNESGTNDKGSNSGLKSKSDNIEIQNNTNTKAPTEDHSPKFEINSKKRDSVELRRSSRRNIKSETNNIITKQENTAMGSGINDKNNVLESKSDKFEIQNTNTKSPNDNHTSKVEYKSKKSVELRRSSRANINSETNHIIAKQDNATMRSDVDEIELRSGLESKPLNIEIQNSTNIETPNEGPKLESKKRDSVELRRSSRRNVNSEPNNIIAKQDSAAMRSDIDETECHSSLGSKSNNIEIENSTNTKTSNEDHSPKVEVNFKKRDSVELRRSTRGNVNAEINNIIAKQCSAAMQNCVNEKKCHIDLGSKLDNIDIRNSINTEMSNEDHNTKDNSKKIDSVELRSSKENINCETSNIITQEDHAAMMLLSPVLVSQTNNIVENDTVHNLPDKTAVTDINTDDIQKQSEKIDECDTSSVTKKDKGGMTLTTQENIENFYKQKSNINQDVIDIEENVADNMSVDDDSDSEHLPYSPLSNLGNNSDDNLSLNDAPFVNDNVTEFEKQSVDITNEGNMDNISPMVGNEINVIEDLGYDYCKKVTDDYNLIINSDQSKSKDLKNGMSDKIVENGYCSENDIKSIPKNKDNITKGMKIIEHKVVLHNNTKEDKQDSINKTNNGYRGENVREIEMASKEVHIYVSESGNKNSKAIKENGFHDTNEDFDVDTTSIHSESSVTSTKSLNRHKLRSNQDKTLEDALLNPEFVKYMEIRQDALAEENPNLNEQEIIAYLYKTWLYEESMKSDVKKNDDLRDINLVKGLNQPQSEAPARTKRNLSLNKKGATKTNTLQRYLRKKKDVVDDRENEEIVTFRKRGMRKNMIIDDDDANIVKNKVDLSEFNSETDKQPTEDDLETSVESTIPDTDQEIVEEGKENLFLEALPSSSDNVVPSSSSNVAEKTPHVEKLNLDPIIQTKAKDDLDRESVDSEDSETPLIRCKLRSKAKKETENSVDVKIKDEDADTLSINSEDSEISSTKRKKKFNGKKIETTMDDPEFLKYLELRQDALIDEHPELTQDEIVTYLYQTWLYEENNKSETKKNDEIQQSTLVKGLKDSVQEPKKIKRKVPKTEKAEKDSVEEDMPGKEKPKRKSVKPFYNEEYSDIEEELEVFEIFKPKSHKVPTEQPINSELNPSASTSEVLQSTIEVYDEVELYFAELTKPKPNVFKGLLREKVCEICEKCNNLVKCKGCNGMFHLNCVKKESEVVDAPVPNRGRKKKKRGRKSKNSEEFDNEDSQDTILEDNISIEEILETDSHAVDAELLEAQLSAKMKEILDSAEKIDYDSYSSDDCLDWNETLPGKCQIVDVKLKPRRSITEIENFKCNNCQQYDTPVCFVCKNAVSKQETTKRQKCHFAHCQKYYHLECLDIWPQTQFNGGEPSKNNKKINEYFEALTCPRHVCHTCVSDDPRGCKTRFSGDKLARCVRCPATYHSFTKCLPAGTQILTASHIICPRHYEHRPGKVPCHVNTGWCFICALGGSLICCEYCPTSFHAECLNIDPPEGGYMCEDCETGRLPLYGEMVWVKLGHYRWWPGIILHPYEIPENLLAVKHSLGEFVVRFFGQYDHYWVNRGRVFPFQEGDSGRVSGQKSKIDAAFTTAMEHAQRACEILKKAEPNEEESMDIASSLLPPHYVKLKVNKPCGTLCGRKMEDPESSLTQCECNPHDEDPCGPYSQCLNRMLLTECGPTCRAGDRCNNRAFEKRLYPKLVPYRTPSRGWGLKTLDDIKAGQFVIEYVGELIDEEEFRRRMRRKHEIRDENFYFLTLDKERMIDAGPKGNLARFMNHCCEPNCETQKWTVLGDVRVGLFALYDIPAHSEVTFNYNLECAGIDKKRCMCGAKRCSGYIGAKPKQEESQSKKTKTHPVKRTYKKRKPEESPSTKNKPKRPIGRPPKPKELTEIEKDLLIIRNATNGLSSDESSRSMSSELDKNPKALKRKRVNFSTEEVVVFDGTESPSVKKCKIDDKLEGD